MGPGDCVGFGRVEVPIWREEVTCFVDDAADEEPDEEAEEEADDLGDVNDVEVCELIAVVLLAKIDDEESQSAGILLPSSSSSESGARVHAGPVLLLLKVLLWVFDTVVVSM
jgi:hypothetical protein